MEADFSPTPFEVGTIRVQAVVSIIDNEGQLLPLLCLFGRFIVFLLIL